MQARGARLQFQSQGVAPSLVARRAMIFGADDLEALNNRKVMARLWLSGRQIALHRALPLFHHQKLLKSRADCTRSWPTATSSLLEQRHPADAAPRALKISRPR
jgi:hypothetical protein